MNNDLVLYAKLHKIMAELETLEKKGEVAFGKTKYSYLTEAAVMAALKPMFIEHKILPVVETTGVDIKDDLTTVHIRVKLIDIETGSMIVSEFSGQGQDKGDKGIYKAYTGALKYFFMKNFMVSTGDDPETVQETEEERQMSKPSSFGGGFSRAKKD